MFENSLTAVLWARTETEPESVRTKNGPQLFHLGTQCLDYVVQGQSFTADTHIIFRNIHGKGSLVVKRFGSQWKGTMEVKVCIEEQHSLGP